MTLSQKATSLKLGNDAVKLENYSQALLHYRHALTEQPGMSKIINFSIDFVQKKLAHTASSEHTTAEPDSGIVTHSESVDVAAIHDTLSLSLELKNKIFHPTQDQIFDRDWYTTHYKYPVEKTNDWLEYYNTIGWKRGEDPSPLFSTSAYLNSEAGLLEHFLATNQSPLSHYCAIGYTEKRDIFFNPLIPFQQKYVTSSPVVKFAEKNNDHTMKRAAAFIHCYYIDIAENIIQQCIDVGLDVYAAFIDGTNFKYLEDKFRGKISYKVFQNRGRDIAPFVTGFTEDIKNYDYALHLHTKKSFHYGSERSDWMDYCLESLLGNLPKIEAIFKKHKNTAIVFPEPPDFLKEQMNWGHNFRRVSALMARLGKELEISDRLDFPAGSMFWFRTKDILPIFELNISPYLFECENGQVDGTLAHAYERLFGMYVLKSKKHLVPIRKSNSDYFDFSVNSVAKTTTRISEIPKTQETYNLSLRHFYPELTPFSFCRSSSAKPRINLLIPTVDPAHIFGGISTAIDFYKELIAAFGMDGRIISTDGPATSLFLNKFPGYSCYTLKYCADPDSLQIVSGVPRSDGDLQIREHDIFIATSWWSANHLQEISNFQKNAYGCALQHIYLVQDYEPHFYGWSSKSQLADDTYVNDWIKVYNTELLLNYFVSKAKNHGPSYILKPELNKSIARELGKLDGIQKENIILVYGRPFAERNCNEILLEAISIWRARDTNSASWQIISLGQQYEHILIDELKIQVLGKVDLEAYAKLLAKAKIGISLMVSPHPSYPPYEMLASGLKTYTNTYDNKQQICDSDRLYMGSGSPADIADFLESATLSSREETNYVAAQIADANFGGGLLMREVVEVIRQQFPYDLK